MDHSILGGLLLEIQRIIVYYALLVQHPVQTFLPLDLTLLRVCRHMCIIGHDVLRQDFQWTEWTIYRCVGSSFMRFNKVRAYEGGYAMLQANNIGTDPIVSFEICGCLHAPGRHSTDIVTRILAPLQLWTFANACRQITEEIPKQSAIAHMTIKTFNRGNSMAFIFQVLELKVRQVFLRYVGELDHNVRRLQELVCTRKVEHDLILGFSRKSIDKAHTTLRENQPEKTLDVFMNCVDLCPKAELIELFTIKSILTNTIGALHGMLGVATLQAICKILLQQICHPIVPLRTIRRLARDAASKYTPRTRGEKHEGYMWDVAALQLLRIAVFDEPEIYMDLLHQQQETFEDAIDLLPGCHLRTQTMKLRKRLEGDRERSLVLEESPSDNGVVVSAEEGEDLHEHLF